MLVNRSVFILFSLVFIINFSYIGIVLGANGDDRKIMSIRKANERGLGKHSWLTSYHTFSFANYYDPKHMGFRSLRVINEDTIKGGHGFDSHPHKNMEIISYVIEGALQHKDSVGNETIIRPNEIQRMSAGTGVIHSEHNNEKNKETHFYQIWILPKKQGVKPSYAQKSFEHELNKNKLTLVVSNVGREGSISIDQDVDIYVSRLKKGDSFEFKPRSNRYLWIQIVKGTLSVNGVEVSAGDGLSSEGEALNFNSKENSEFILFDLN